MVCSYVTDAEEVFAVTVPYGPYFSLDGVHPSTAGHRLIANAAADALIARYALSISKVTPALATPCP